MQGAAAMAGGVREDQVAVASTGVIGVLLDAGEVIRGIARARGELREYGHGDFSEAIQTTDKFAKEVEVDVALPSGTVRLTAQAKGAGMISPGVRDDALLRPDRRGADGRDRRPAARRVRGALVRPRVRRRPALHQRHRDPAGVGRVGRGGRAADRGRGALRRGAGLGAAQARAGHRARRRGLQADRPRGRARRRRRASWPASRARSPTRRWSRPRCTAGTRTGAGSRRRSAPRCYDTAPLPLDIFIEGVQVCSGGRGGAATTSAALAEAVAGDEVEYDGRAARRRRRGRGLLLRPLARVRDDQRGLHDVMQRRRNPARGAPVHPGVPRQDGRDQVRRRGDDRPDAARGVRARRRAPEVRRPEPDHRPRRRAGHHRLHEAARHAGRVRRRAAGAATPTRSRSRRWCSSARSTRTSSSRINRHGQPAVGLSGDDGQLFRVSTMAGPGGEDIGFVGQDRARRRRRHHPHRRGLHPGHRVGRRRPRRAARTTSTPTRRRARSPARWAPTR